MDASQTRLGRLKPWQYIAGAVLASIVLSELIVAPLSIYFHGEVTRDYLETGFVASLFVASIVVSLLIFFIGRIKKAEQALLDQTRYLTNILASSRELGIVSSDRAFTLKYINPTQSLLFDCVGEDVQGKNIVDFLKDYEVSPEKFAQAIASVESGKEFSFRIAKEISGTTRTFDATLLAIVDEAGNSIGYALISRDITERLLFEKEIQRQNASLEEINKDLEKRIADEIEKRRRNEQLVMQQARLASMGELMAAIAHQWRQPLNTLGLLAQDLPEALSHNELTETYLNDAVEKMSFQINYLSNTIDSFRSFLKPSTGKTPFDVEAALSEVVGILSSQLQYHKIEVHFEKRFDTPVMVEGYPAEFKQVLVHLLRNAQAAIVACAEKEEADKKWWVKIVVAREADCVSIGIADNGGGIPDEILTRVFDPYFSTKITEANAGIGLYMAKIIVEQNMCGELSALNNADGAVFTVKLPLFRS